MPWVRVVAIAVKPGQHGMCAEHFSCFIWRCTTCAYRGVRQPLSSGETNFAGPLIQPTRLTVPSGITFGVSESRIAFCDCSLVMCMSCVRPDTLFHSAAFQNQRCIPCISPLKTFHFSTGFLRGSRWKPKKETAETPHPGVSGVLWCCHLLTRLTFLMTRGRLSHPTAELRQHQDLTPALSSISFSYHR